MRVSLVWHVIVLAVCIVALSVLAVSPASTHSSTPLSSKSALKGPPLCC